MSERVEKPADQGGVVMTDERRKELRFKMWTLAQRVLVDTANARAAMPFLIDEEYEYAREFMLMIAKRTRPGGYRDNDDEEKGPMP